MKWVNLIPFTLEIPGLTISANHKAVQGKHRPTANQKPPNSPSLDNLGRAYPRYKPPDSRAPDSTSLNSYSVWILLLSSRLQTHATVLSTCLLYLHPSLLFRSFVSSDKRHLQHQHLLRSPHTAAETSRPIRNPLNDQRQIPLQVTLWNQLYCHLPCHFSFDACKPLCTSAPNGHLAKTSYKPVTA